MEPIINPYLFYWFDVSNILHNIFIALSVSTGICLGVCLVLFGVNLSEAIEYNENKKWVPILRKYVVAFATAFVISLICVVFIPSKTTCLEMLVSGYVTNNTIGAGVESIKQLIDYIVASIKSLM